MSVLRKDGNQKTTKLERIGKVAETKKDTAECVRGNETNVVSRSELN